MFQPFLTAMQRIGRLDFEARSGAGSVMNWNHHGHGSVVVSVLPADAATEGIGQPRTMLGNAGVENDNPFIGPGIADVEIQFDERFTLDNGTPCQDRKRWRFSADGIHFLHWRQQQFLEVLCFTAGLEPATDATAHSPMAA